MRHHVINSTNLLKFLEEIGLWYSNAARVYREQGLVGFLKVFLGHIGMEYFDRSLIFLKCDLADTSINDMGCGLSMVTEKDIESGRFDSDNGFFSKNRTLHRLRAGHKLFVAKEGEEMASCLWIEQDNASIWWFSDLPLDLPTHIAYLSAIYTPMNFRNRGFASKLVAQVLRQLSMNGIESVISVVAPDNEASLKVLERIGYKRYQVVRYRHFFFLRYYLVTDIRSRRFLLIFTIGRSPKTLWKTFLQN